jgi:hypothetical protein
MAASNAELESRLKTVEDIILAAITLPKMSVEINDVKITNKTGYMVYGQISGINEGLLFVGVSLVATPTINSHIKEPFIFKAF